MAIVHVYPLDHEHATDGAPCWCEPDFIPVERDDDEPAGYWLHRELH